ncbi:MAG: ATP-binding protein [Chloroflexi bacterium]|nr:ATP-binding protein [Chloroflexota bacterium]
MSGAVPVGTTKGPGESPHTYTLVAPDADDQLKIGEFVAYDARVDGELRSVLGRIDARRPLKLYPDAFMADPQVPPSRVAELIGFDHATPELYEFDVAVLGYFDDALGFVNPRVAPRAGRPVYLVPDDDLAHALSRNPHGKPGAAHVGSLLTRARDRVPITLDMNEFASTHLAIIAGTGAGKSYLAGVIVEELMQPSVGAAVVIVDPHGEYGTLEEIANHPGFRGEGYRARTLVVRPEQIKIRRDLLHPSDIYQLVGSTHGLSGPQREVLRLALRAVGIDRGLRWTYRQLTEAVNDVELSGGPRNAGDEGADYMLVKRALMWRLNATLGRQDGIFDDYEHTSLQELIRPGQCTVVQLNEVPREEQQVIAATLLRRSFDGRVGTAKGRIGSGEEQHLPAPVFTLVEEAHHFAPASEEVPTTNLLKQILAEGRKFGFAVGLISQRPGKLDQDVLSQCMTQCILRVVNPVDQQAIAGAVESAGRELLAELPALSKGQAIVAGAAVNTTVLCRVRPRLTPHGGESPDVVDAWRRARSQLPPVDRSLEAADPESARTPEERLFGSIQ